MKSVLSYLPAILVLALCGCFGASKKSQSDAQNQRRVYAPRVEMPAPVVQKPLFQDVKLRPFQILPPFGGRLFVVSRAGGEFATDYYNGWISSPEELIAVQTWRYLEKSGLFRSVSPASSGSVAPYGIDGIVTELYLDYSTPGKPQACVGLRLAVLDEHQASFPILYTVEKRSAAPIADTGSCVAAQALNEALQKTLAELVADLKKAPLK